MHLFRLLLAITLLPVFLPGISQALDLFEAYGKAKTHDPEYLSVYYDYRATLTLPEQATVSLKQANRRTLAAQARLKNAEQNLIRKVSEENVKINSWLKKVD